jgi:hypothetical protein
MNAPLLRYFIEIWSTVLKNRSSMKLQESSYRWAIKHLFKESDTDLFPKPFELTIIHEMEEELIKELLEIDLGAYKWNAARRFVVPKDDVAYRVATQLHPIDSIILGALIYEFGPLIEAKRADAHSVFSYRLNTLPDGTMYANQKTWNQFWKACQMEVLRERMIKNREDDEDAQEEIYVLKNTYSHVVTCDIADFYNQIYLHTIENQLIHAHCPNQVKVAVKALIISLNEANSRGIPVGPHSAHLLAEMTLIPVDASLALQGIVYKRYVDDFIFFCTNEKEARIRIQQLAEILDKEQRLILQRQKTKIYTADEFYQHTKQVLYEEPVYDIENEVIQIISQYSGGNAYARIRLGNIKPEHLAKLTVENITDLLDQYIADKNYEKLRWFYRRLSQIGIPHAIDFSIANFDKIIPALNDVCLYINSCAENYQSDWKMIGETVIEILQDEIVKANPFYQISLLNLFVYNKSLNHIDSLVKLFKNANEDIRRKILLSTLDYNSGGWIYQLKEDQQRLSPWTRRAYMIATKALVADQKKFLHNSIKAGLTNNDILEKMILNWAK